MSSLSLFRIRYKQRPMNNRRILDLILSLPADYKLSARMNLDIINQNWPELLEFGFNARTLDYKIHTVLTNPRGAARGVLRRVGLA